MHIGFVMKIPLPILKALPKPSVNVAYEIPEVNNDIFLLINPLILAGFKAGMNRNTTDTRIAILTR